MGCGASKSLAAKQGTKVPIVFCIVGPPASVKTALCEKLQKDHGFDYVTIGEAQRRAVKENEKLGPEVKAALDDHVAKGKEARKSGQPVSDDWAGNDELNTQVLEWFLTTKHCTCLLDGYPSTKVQSDMLESKSIKVSKVVVISVEEEVLVKLATGRRFDYEKKACFHIDGWGGMEKPPDNAQVESRLVPMAGVTEEGERQKLGRYQQKYGEITQLFEESFPIDGAPFIKEGKDLSDLALEVIAFLLPPQMLSMAPPGGKYDKCITVTLKSDIADAVIYYTLDGTPPTEENCHMSGPPPLEVKLEKTTTIKAICIPAGKKASPVEEALYLLPHLVTAEQVEDKAQEISAVVGQITDEADESEKKKLQVNLKALQKEHAAMKAAFDKQEKARLDKEKKEAAAAEAEAFKALPKEEQVRITQEKKEAERVKKEEEKARKEAEKAEEKAKKAEAAAEKAAAAAEEKAAKDLAKAAEKEEKERVAQEKKEETERLAMEKAGAAAAGKEGEGEKKEGAEEQEAGAAAAPEGEKKEEGKQEGGAVAGEKEEEKKERGQEVGAAGAAGA